MTSLRDFAERYTAAWCSQEAAQVASFFTATGLLAINGGPPAVGRAEITAVARGFMSQFPDLVVALDRLEETPTGPRYHWTLTGTDRESHRKVCISGYEIWRMDGEGLIAESQGHFDVVEYQRQLGQC